MGAPERRVLPDPAGRQEPRPITDEERVHLEQLASVLRSLRLSLPAPPGRRRVSQERLAEAAGISQPHVSHLEGGRFRPRETTLRRIAGALAELGGGDADELHRVMLEVLGPALAAPSRDPARVEWHRSKRQVRKARRRRKQVKLEAEVGRQIFPLADRIARVHAADRLELSRDARRLDEQLSRLRQTVREGERRREPGSWADGAPMGTGSREERAWQRQLIAECEERFGRRRLDEEVRLAAKRAEAEAETVRLERRMVVAAEMSDAQQAAAEHREAQEAERFATALDLLAGNGDPVPTASEAPAALQGPLTGDDGC